MNPFNKKDNKCFPYVVVVALNYEEIKKTLQRITKIKPFINKYNWEGMPFINKYNWEGMPFINKYNWEGINFQWEKDDWEKFEKNNVTNSLNVLYAKK